MPSASKRNAIRRNPRRRKRRGAAMLIVMMILLIITATATFAIHATSVEIRSAGYARQRMQTQYVAQAGLLSALSMVEQSGPEALTIVLERSTTGSTSRQLAPGEPLMEPSRANHRVSLGDFASGGAGLYARPIETAVGAESLGPGLVYRPEFEVDINDSYRYAGLVAGNRSDGNGTLEYVVATYTARGRTPLNGLTDEYSPTVAAAPSTMRRGFHESTVDARAIGISGPTRRR